jgi:hypothetical protein
VASAAAAAAVNMAARSPPAEAPLPWLTASATAGSNAAPIAAPTWRLVLITPPTRPWSASATPVLAVTMVPNAVPAVPKPTGITAASSGLYPPPAGSRVRIRNPSVAIALVRISTRRMPTRRAIRAPNMPAVNPTTPCGAMISPVASGE